MVKILNLKPLAGVRTGRFGAQEPVLVVVLQLVTDVGIFVVQDADYALYQPLRVVIVDNQVTVRRFKRFHQLGDLVGRAAAAGQHAAGLVGLQRRGKFVQTAEPAADGNDGIAGLDQVEVASDVVQTGEINEIKAVAWQAVFTHVLPQADSRRETDAHAAGVFGGRGRIVRQPDR